MRIYEETAQPVVETSELSIGERGSSLHVKERNSLEKKQLQKLIGYARVSTEGQGEGESLQKQEAAIRDYALQHGATLHAFHDERASGRSGYRERPEFQQAVISPRSYGYPIVCTRIDRLRRDARFLTVELIEAGVSVISVEHGRELDEVELKSMARKAELKAAHIARGTRRSLKAKEHSSTGARAGGLRSGEVRADIGLDHNAAVMGKIEEIEARHGRTLNFSELARELVAAGVQTSQGGRVWHAQTVKRVLEGSVRFISEP